MFPRQSHANMCSAVTCISKVRYSVTSKICSRASQSCVGLPTLTPTLSTQPAGVRAVLEAGAQAAPEVLLLGFVQAHADWGPLQREVRLGSSLPPLFLPCESRDSPSLTFGNIDMCSSDTRNCMRNSARVTLQSNKIPRRQNTCSNHAHNSTGGRCAGGDVRGGARQQQAGAGAPVAAGCGHGDARHVRAVRTGPDRHLPHQRRRPGESIFILVTVPQHHSPI